MCALTDVTIIEANCICEIYRLSLTNILQVRMLITSAPNHIIYVESVNAISSPALTWQDRCHSCLLALCD